MITLPNADRENSRVEMVRSFGLIGEPRPAIHDEVAALARDLSGASTALVSLVDSQRNWFAGIANFPDADQCRWDSFCTHVVAAPDELLWVEDARADFRFATNPYVLNKPFLRFYAGMPIVVNGFPVGSLCVLDSQPKAYDPVFVRQLERLARIVGDDLANRHKVRSLRQSLLASADALIDCDDHGVITDWSAGAERLFGFARAEALGKRINIIIPPDRAEAHDRGFEHWRKSGAARFERRIELLAQRKDGSPVNIELWMSVTHIHGVRHIHSNVRDITERKQNAAELLAAKVEAEAANKAKSTFLANMSHELRTPMNGVVAVADLLAKTGLNPQQSELVSIIQSSSGQLLRLVGDILDLSRIESGEMVLVSSPMSLRDLIREVTGGLEVAASEKHLSLSVSIDPAVSEQVEGDATRLKQVLTNLVSNAIKFTESGSVTVTVRRAGEDVRFEVHDTGIGFSEEQRAVIFERFQQADGSITRKFGGTGLGLAISRELVAVMGGELDCCGSTGEGASFWFTLPLRPVATVAAPVENAAEVHTTNSRALVVDDNATNRRVAELLLQSVGADVVSVEDGQQAVDAFRRERYDVILMDMMMPVMDGLAATKAIRRIEAKQRLRHTPIIMLTASSLPEHITASMDAGADLHLLKPINAAALFDALNVVGNAESDENERPDAHADG